MKVTIIYDNETWQAGLEADWGFSCLVETEGRGLLFDTGARGTVLEILARYPKTAVSGGAGKVLDFG